MKIRKLKAFLGLFLCFGLSAGYAQQGTTTTGGDASGSGGSAAFSVGQIDYTTIGSAGESATQGLQQPYEIFPLNIIETDLKISLAVFPNPTTDNLTLEVKDYNDEKLFYQLLDSQGRLIERDRISSASTKINTAALPSANYFINIIHNNEGIQSFQIVKH